MRRAFGPSESHAFFLSQSAILYRRVSVFFIWIRSRLDVLVFRPSVLLTFVSSLTLWSGVVILSLHFFFNFTFVVFLSSICSFTLNLETLLRLHLKVIQVFLVWVTAVRSIHYFKKNTFRSPLELYFSIICSVSHLILLISFHIIFSTTFIFILFCACVFLIHLSTLLSAVINNFDNFLFLCFYLSLLTYFHSSSTCMSL